MTTDTTTYSATMEDLFPVTTNEALLAKLIEGHEVSDSRKESLALAIAAGASDSLLAKLRDTMRLARKDSIILPAGRYENLSRGRGWCRKGKGGGAQWAEREGKGYLVDAPGRWVVGCSDGFSRKDETTWDVAHVTVGGDTWTIAD